MVGSTKLGYGVFSSTSRVADVMSPQDGRSLGCIDFERMMLYIYALQKVFEKFS